MKLVFFRVIAIALLFSIHSTSNAQAPDWIWAKTVGSSVNDLCEAIAVDDSGNVFTTGSYEGTVDFDPGPGTFQLTSLGILDAYVLKTDSAGNFVWAVSIGGAGSDRGFSLKTDNLGAVYITGRYANTVDFDPGAGVFNLTSNGDKDVFVLKLNSVGNFVWAKSVGGTGDDQGFGLSLDNQKNILVTGFFQNTVDFNPDAGSYNLSSNGNYDAYVMKLENNGSFLWAVSFGSTLNDNGSSVVSDTSGNVYTTGYFTGTVDFDPGAGISNLITNGFMDIFVLKMDGNGNLVWAKSMGGTQTDNGTGIYADAAGNVFTTGSFQGTADFDPGIGSFNLTSAGAIDIYISKLDNNGNFAWAAGFGQGVGLLSDDYSYSIAADNKGNIYTTGSFKATVDFDPGPGVANLVSAGNNDAFVLKLDSAGNYMWAINAGGLYSEQAKSIAIDKTNHAHIGGHYMSSSVSFDNDTLVNTVFGGATADIFIAKIDSGLIVVSNVVANLQSSDTTFCEKNCIDFTDLSTNNPTSWQWYFPGASPDTSTLQNPAGICYNSYGNFDVTLVACNQFGCDSITFSNFITSYQNPVGAIYQSNDTLYSQPAFSYQWYESTSGIIAGATNSYFVPQQPGSYFCLITNTDGCEATSNVIVITGMADYFSSNGLFDVVPNPNNGSFEIVFIDEQLNGDFKMEIYNSIGEMVINSNQANQQSQQLNLSDGIYFLTLELNNKFYRKKFVVKN